MILMTSISSKKERVVFWKQLVLFTLNKLTFSSAEIYLLDFLPLHLEHNTCKFEGILLPPFLIGII